MNGPLMIVQNNAGGQRLTMRTIVEKEVVVQVPAPAMEVYYDDIAISPTRIGPCRLRCGHMSLGDSSMLEHQRLRAREALLSRSM